MRWVVALALSAVVLGLPCAATTAKAKTKKHTPQQSSTVTAKHKSTAPTGAKTVSSQTRRRGRRYGRSAPAPSYQTHPDPERYQQIQQALADRGYFKGEVNGQWNDDSVEALKHFQADQKMEPDGKINSLSLIGLGLGPKHDGSSVAASSVPATPPPVPDEESPDEH